MPISAISRERRLVQGDLTSLLQPHARIFNQPPCDGTKAAVRRDSAKPASISPSVFSVTERGSRLASVALIETLATGRLAPRAASPLEQFAGQGRAWAYEPAALQTILSNEAGDSALGNAVSVSEEGCVVATPAALLGDHFQVILQFRAYSARIACRRIGTNVQEHNGETRSFSSLQYRNLIPAHIGFLRLLVDRHIQESTPLRCV